MKVGARVFRFFTDSLGIRETVALVDVDLSAAIPVYGLTAVAFPEQITHRVMMAEDSPAGAGSSSIDVDPRVPSDWTRVLVDGIDLDPTTVAGTAVPAGHDYKILSFGAVRSGSTLEAFLFKNNVGVGVSPAASTALISLQDSTPGTGLTANDGGAMMGPPASLWIPRFDPATLKCVLVAGDAMNVTVTLTIISAPPGVLLP